MVDKNRISATTKTPKFYYAHRYWYGCMLFLPAFEIRLDASANSLPPQNAFLCGWGAQHSMKLLCSAKRIYRQHRKCREIQLMQ
jgi:hypothetical protein